LIKGLKNLNFAYVCSWQRLCAMLTKEFIQMRRDKVTFAMLVIIPLMQLILFGFAINTNPKDMPTVIIDNDHTSFTRTFISGLKNTKYFLVKKNVKSELEAKKLLATGRTQFIITIPPNFTRDLLRNKKPQLLLEADATDPVATGSAINAFNHLAKSAFMPLFRGTLSYLQNNKLIDSNLTMNENFIGNIKVVTHANYNSEGITSYNIVPGLLGVILTMTLVMVTSMGITREREQGTMEHLLSTPVRPLEVMLGKLIPYVIVGYCQMAIILLAAIFVFGVPFHGTVLLLAIAALPFIASNLAMGLTFSSLSKNQLQAVQMSMFFFLPSILLSGFMFPFRGMPFWAQNVGSMLPLTYFLRITRGIILKGNGIMEVWIDIWPIILFMVIAIFIAMIRYRRTLD
jgi:ABC-2 type transport system permease protein